MKTTPQPKRTLPPLVIRDHHPETPDPDALRRAREYVFSVPRPTPTPQAAD